MDSFNTNSIRSYITALVFLCCVVVSIDLPGVNGVFKLTFMLLTLSYIKFRDLRVDYVFLLLSLMFFSIMLSSIIFPLYDVDYQLSSILYRLRYWFFEFIFAMSSFLYFKYEKKSTLNLIFKYCLIVFFIVSVSQSIIGHDVFGRRAHLFLNEPSQAGGVLLFILFVHIYLFKSVYGQINKAYVFFGLVSIILTGSKGAILTLFIGVALVFLLMKKTWSQLITGTVVFVFILLSVFALMGDKVEYTIVTLGTIYDVGIRSLSYEYQVWDSFIMRFLGWFASFRFLFEYPFGIGAGGFHFLLPNLVHSTGISVDSKELTGVLYEGLYSTPKSYFLELMVSGGIFTTIIFIKFIFKILVLAKVNSYLYIFSILLLIQGFLVELNPYLAFLVCMIAFEKKSDIGQC